MLYFCLKFVPILRIIQYNLVVLEVAKMISMDSVSNPLRHHYETKGPYWSFFIL